MFYAMRMGKIDCKKYQFDFAADEIAVLNQIAIDNDNQYDIIAVSFHAYKYLKQNYQLMLSGASLGSSKHGPKLISKKDQIADKPKIAIPGKFTSSELSLEKYFKSMRSSRRSFSTIKDDVDYIKVYCSYNDSFKLLENNEVDASLLIHEAQLKYQELGYKLIVDLGTWWHEYSGAYRLPLGCNVAKKTLGTKVIEELDEILMQSIIWGKNNFDEVMSYACNFAGHQMDKSKSKQYLDMYVDESTIKLTEADLKSIELFLS
jgi:1,4-dihydroxy-6-naphthoate synthase